MLNRRAVWVTKGLVDYLIRVKNREESNDKLHLSPDVARLCVAKAN